MEIYIEPTVEKFIRALQKPVSAKTLRTLDLLEKYGHQLRMPLSKKVNKNIFELRIQSLQDIRIFYTFHTNKVILIHAFAKKTNKTPKKELGQAMKIFKRLT